MTKYLIVFAILLSSLKGRAQDIINYRDDKITGFIFKKEKFVFKSIDDASNRYTPSFDDIKKMECILSKKLRSLSVEKSTKGCPSIIRKQKRYTRQYVGFIDSNGHKVLWVNFFWNNELLKKADKEIINVSDGCSYYWNIEVDLDNETLRNLKVNGQG